MVSCVRRSWGRSTGAPVIIIESGPAAGVVGVQALARQIGIDKAISFDMGGTTAKASIIENGALSRALEYSVGGGVMIGSRLLSGAGYTLKVPAIDLAWSGRSRSPIVHAANPFRRPFFSILPP